MLTDIHSIFGYVISRYLFERNFVSDKGKRFRMIPESPMVKHSEHLKHTSDQQQFLYLIGKSLVDGGVMAANGASKLMMGKDKIQLLRKTSLKQFFKVLSTNMFKFLRRIKRFFSHLTFEQKYYVVGMILANLPDVDIALFIISFFLSFFKGFSRMIDRIHRLWELFISLTNKKQEESSGGGMTSSFSSSSLNAAQTPAGSSSNLSQYDSDSEDTQPTVTNARRNWKAMLERRDKNSLTFRRTISHSLPINLLLSPLIGFGVQKVLGLHGFNSFTHCTTLSACCLSSHLLLDFMTNFGTALLYPISSELYSFGIVTSWDFTLIVFFYSWLTASRLNRWKQSNVFWIGLFCLGLIFIWKRAMMSEVYSRYYFFMEAQKRKHTKSIQNAPSIWLQPSNFFNGQYTVMKYDPKTDLVSELKTVQATKYISLINWILTAFGFSVSDVRQIQINDKLGKFKGQIAPRQFLMVIYSNLKNRKVLYEMIKSSTPSLIFIISYIMYLIVSDD
ncbi:predicted protein [Naegleria gruberi]|uniref:Predicted protein n=1 Tax=Naegleria gruberi TaxID=5762 RepID=D2VVB7_NAEGR|nr:uncharacterized protein NAEGRDRAFT_72959 [Naegleria gruberi]EFC39280.1 predicted protein [Naegleria gruberi]|eukprot:XP_002672024.1 predicted protein [Naegleria gruberi strain NEG-M]